MIVENELHEQLIAFFKLLSNTPRLRMAGALATTPASAEQLAAALGLSTADVTRHLGLLCDAGLVAQIEGRYVFQERALETMARTVLAGQKRTAEAAASGDDYERKVLRDYLHPDGRIKALPSQLKKQMVVLQYVSRAFAPGVRYTEKEVNEALACFHEDTATLRRALVDNTLMARDHGIYWQGPREATTPPTNPGRETNQ